ncbi:uncharacterized protein UV8b_07528 [Ustilaginoidea virens]|uniref:Uncharacterized protein n=1 Tax=Ustilaginoidea virens TaxID=1159556 RepID=A0A8E5ML34_USTVR|nr:uncharacterized protein UV8b_07528 [Ustilaginoidea virens]QUC23287.1 hypothetical protein UV8b_07528 [Ustilaginoidea virens]
MPMLLKSRPKRSTKASLCAILVRVFQVIELRSSSLSQHMAFNILISPWFCRYVSQSSSACLKSSTHASLIVTTAFPYIVPGLVELLQKKAMGLESDEHSPPLHSRFRGDSKPLLLID